MADDIESRSCPSHMVEQQLLLRMPPEVAKLIRKKLKDKATVPIRFVMINDRMGKFYAGDKVYNLTLVDLLCYTETHKTIDKRTYYKSADVGQMLLVEDLNEPPPKNTPIIMSQTWKFDSGITPPTRHIRERKWRKVPIYDAEEVMRVMDDVIRICKKQDTQEHAEVIHILPPSSHPIPTSMPMDVIQSPEHDGYSVQGSHHSSISEPRNSQWENSSQIHIKLNTPSIDRIGQKKGLHRSHSSHDQAAEQSKDYEGWIRNNSTMDITSSSSSHGWTKETDPNMPVATSTSNIHPTIEATTMTKTPTKIQSSASQLTRKGGLRFSIKLHINPSNQNVTTGHSPAPTLVTTSLTNVHSSDISLAPTATTREIQTGTKIEEEPYANMQMVESTSAITKSLSSTTTPLASSIQFKSTQLHSLSISDDIPTTSSQGDGSNPLDSSSQLPLSLNQTKEKKLLTPSIGTTSPLLSIVSNTENQKSSQGSDITYPSYSSNNGAVYTQSVSHHLGKPFKDIPSLAETKDEESDHQTMTTRVASPQFNHPGTEERNTNAMTELTIQSSYLSTDESAGAIAGGSTTFESIRTIADYPSVTEANLSSSAPTTRDIESSEEYKQLFTSQQKLVSELSTFERRRDEWTLRRNRETNRGMKKRAEDEIKKAQEGIQTINQQIKALTTELEKILARGK